MPNLSYLDATKRKIESLLKSCDIPREISQHAIQEVEGLEEIANRMFWGSRGRRDKEIRVAIDKLKAAIQSHVSRSGSSRTCLLGVKLDIHSFTERVKKMEKELVDELYQSLPEDDYVDVVSSPICSNMVGLSDQFDELKSKIIDSGDERMVFSLIGMGGIGKTTLARKVYEDRDVCEHFDLRVWVTVGRNCRSKEILGRLVGKIVVKAHHDDVVAFLRENLKGKKYLIVLDDVWGKYAEYQLQRSYIYEKDALKNPFPDEGNGSRVLLTTRSQQMTEFYQPFYFNLTMRLLNKEESWVLLHEKVFANEPCPFQLEKAGKQIPEKCDGLPLTIVTIAGLLSKKEKTREYWSEILAQKNHQIFLMAYDEVSKVLFPSYEYLPRILSMCFLYMGVFPRKYKVPQI